MKTIEHLLGLIGPLYTWKNKIILNASLIITVVHNNASLITINIYFFKINWRNH